MLSVKSCLSGRSVDDLAVMSDRAVSSDRTAMAKKKSPNAFTTWVEATLIPRYDTVRAIAELIDMSESGLGRGLKKGTLSVQKLLQLALATEEPPAAVLRAAGKNEEADLLDQLYGASTDALTSSQREVLQLWATIDKADRPHVIFVLQRAAAPALSAEDADDVRRFLEVPEAGRRALLDRLPELPPPALPHKPTQPKRAGLAASPATRG